MKISLSGLKQFTLYFALTFGYRIALDWAYIHIVSCYFDYMGFYNAQTSGFFWNSYLCLIAGILASSYCFKKFKTNISSKVIVLMYLIVYVPFTSLIRFGHFPERFVFLNVIYWINIFFFNFLFNGGGRKHVAWKIKKNDMHLKIFFGLAIIFAWFVLIAVSGKYAHFHMNFSLGNVYELRAQAKADSMPGIMRYLFGWARAALLVAIAYYASCKRYINVAVAFLALFLSFGYDGSKVILFSGVVIVLINTVPGKNLLQDSKIIVLGVALAVLLGNVGYLISGNYSLASYITRRTLYTPAHLNWAYYDYFLTRMPDYFRGSFLRHFGFSTPYPNLSLLIGAEYANNSSANNGLFGDAYANLGAVGVVIMPILLIAFLGILDRCTSELNGLFCLSIALYIALELADSSFFASLLSHGLLIIVLLLTLIKIPHRREVFLNVDSTEGTGS